MTEITLRIESPHQPDVVRLIEALDIYQGGLYPSESNHFLGVEALAAPGVRFFVARRDGRALGCGALRIDPGGYGEVKRMFVSPEARGLKLGRRLLDRIEEDLSVEVGLLHSDPAGGIYRFDMRAGEKLLLSGQFTLMFGGEFAGGNP